MRTATAKQSQSSRSPMSFNNTGYTGLQQFGGYIEQDFERELLGQRGMRKYREMSLSNPIAAASLGYFRQTMIRAKWRIEPAGNKPADIEAAEFVEQCLGDMRLGPFQVQTRERFYGQSLSYLTYGFALPVMNFKRRLGRQSPTFVSTPDGGRKLEKYIPSSRYNDGRVGWAGFEPRGQETILRWDFSSPEGYVLGAWQMGPPEYKLDYLPIEKCLHFVTNDALGSPEGTSILRPCFRYDRLSRKTENAEAIGIARNLHGYPVLIAPEGLDLFDATDPTMVSLLEDTKKVVTNIKRDEQQGVVLPYGWDLKLLSMATSGINTTEIVQRYDSRIGMTMQTEFIFLGLDRGGAYELAKQKEELWLGAVEGYLNADCAIFSEMAIPTLIDLNDFGELSGYPRAVPEDVTIPDIAPLADYIQKLTGGAAAMTTDRPLEEYLRDRASLPKMESPEADLDAREPEPVAPGEKDGGKQPRIPGPPQVAKDLHYAISDLLMKREAEGDGRHDLAIAAIQKLQEGKHPRDEERKALALEGVSLIGDAGEGGAILSQRLWKALSAQPERPDVRELIEEELDNPKELVGV